MSKLMNLFAALALAVTGLIAAPGAASASTTSTPDYVRLNLQVTDSTGHATYGSLRCNPAGGSHADPTTACRQLATVNGDPGALHNLIIPFYPCDRLPIEPVTVRMTGYWGSTLVDFKRTFMNSCDVMQETGSVFAV
ncbi:SSI family serine proteinase inhibitor [Luteipulveratus flavus]|uniref:SSI family serine proteinase inhibitor n=1 Tax=Luteipulveratus flavus TaxID=3031728 RepID=A0ABT6CBH0_9MICO|nr:SSI family serine proteinase inhibitor [Luteipulveratus sp. YIM 133296]MDF8266236.1 SSI family serine proteinase inhibitor [Luteipulveratus sp. YIM 133296]